MFITFPAKTAVDLSSDSSGEERGAHEQATTKDILTIIIKTTNNPKLIFLIFENSNLDYINVTKSL